MLEIRTYLEKPESAKVEIMFVGKGKHLEDVEGLSAICCSSYHF